MIQEVILDHDKHFRTRSYTERENFVGGRLPRDYYQETMRGRWRLWKRKKTFLMHTY
jgi:hypothetical protein